MNERVFMGYIHKLRAKIGHDEIIFVGAGVCIHKGGKLLLQKRKDNGLWAMHGGALEPGESAEDAAMRELKEETGLTALRLELLGVFSGEGMGYVYPNGDRVQIVCILFLCEEFSGELSRQRAEVMELEWFDIGRLPGEISPPDIRPLRAAAEYITKRDCEK